MAPPATRSPSPVIPILLIAILSCMMMVPAYMRYEYHTARTAVAFRKNITLGAFLIPVVLIIAVQAFGMPSHRPREPLAEQNLRRTTPPDLIDTFSQISSISLILVIIVLLMLIGLNSGYGSAPWQSHSSLYVAPRNRYYGYRKSSWYSMY